MIAYVYRPRRRDAAGKLVTVRDFSGRYRLDGNFAITQVALHTSDKQAAQQKLRAIIKEKELERAGIIAPQTQRKAAERPLVEHLDEFIADLERVGRTPQYLYILRIRNARLFKECKWRFMRQITVDGFVSWRTRQKTKTPKTLNEYHNSLNVFFNWMVKMGRMPENPIRSVQKADLRGRQQRRRAFSDEEFAQLLAHAGPDRLLCLTAAYTGLRIGELRQLLWADVRLEHKRPHIVARAATTKNRKEAVIPLHPRLAVELQQLRTQKDPAEGDAVFYIIRNHAHRFRAILKRAGIQQIDAIGRRLDFHALRYTFATKLAREGVAQRTAQELMRHSDPKLTAMIYTDPTQLPTFDCVEKLPWPEIKAVPNGETMPQIAAQLSDTASRRQSRRGTKRDGKNPSQNVEVEPLSHSQSSAVTASHMVLRMGLEPIHLSAHAPQACVSTNSTT